MHALKKCEYKPQTFRNVFFLRKTSFLNTEFKCESYCYVYLKFEICSEMCT